MFMSYTASSCFNKVGSHKIVCRKYFSQNNSWSKILRMNPLVSVLKTANKNVNKMNIYADSNRALAPQSKTSEICICKKSLEILSNLFFSDFSAYSKRTRAFKGGHLIHPRTRAFKGFRYNWELIPAILIYSVRKSTAIMWRVDFAFVIHATATGQKGSIN